MINESNSVVTESRIKTYRWFFYISSIQVLAYFIVPALIFPGKYILHLELISALTLGLVVALFYLLVNIIGLYIDRSRRLLYLMLMTIVIFWFIWVTVTWMYIERMDYILR